MTMTPEEKLAMARECAAAYFENDPLDTGRKELAALIRKGGPADDQDATQICLLAIDRMQERVRAETDWQDIATAPRDGTDVLLWVVHPNAKYADTDFAQWCGPVVARWIDFNGGGWTWHGLNGQFTHWRPLPAPPAIRETPHAEG